MSFPAALDGTITASPLYRRPSHHTNRETDEAMASSWSASSSSINIRTEKFTPHASPLERGRRPLLPISTPRSPTRRSRTLGRVAILIIVLVVCGMGVNEYLYKENGYLSGSSSEWFNSGGGSGRGTVGYVGGGSVIGMQPLSEEAYDAKTTEYMTPGQELDVGQQAESVDGVNGMDDGDETIIVPVIGTNAQPVVALDSNNRQNDGPDVDQVENSSGGSREVEVVLRPEDPPHTHVTQHDIVLGKLPLNEAAEDKAGGSDEEVPMTGAMDLGGNF